MLTFTHHNSEEMFETDPFSLEVADYLISRSGTLENAILTWWRLLLWKYKYPVIKTAICEMAGNILTQTKFCSAESGDSILVQ